MGLRYKLSLENSTLPNQDNEWLYSCQTMIAVGLHVDFKDFDD